MADFDYVEVDSAKLYTEVIGTLMDYCNEPLYPGDERRVIGESLVLVLTGLYNLFNDKAKQRALRYARGVVLDAIGDRYGVNRADPEKASATFRFSVSAAQSENIVIPAGTRITTDGSVYFATEETVVLTAGTISLDILGICTEGGSAYNGFTAGSIGTLVDLIPFIERAENITTSSGGDDGEPYSEEGDNRYRERIRLSPATQSTAGPESAYRYFVMSADPDIVDVSFDYPEDEPNTVNIYPLMTGGALPDESVFDKIQEVLADDVRPMTDHVQVFAPEAVDYEVEIRYYITKDNQASAIQTIEGEGGAIDQYNAWQTAALGRSINPDQLRRYLLAPSTGTGALRVDIVKPALTVLTKTQVARLSGAPVVSYEVVSG